MIAVMSLLLAIIVSSAVGLAGAILLSVATWGRRVGEEPRCRRCGYDLRGSSSGRCGECGSHLDVPRAVVKGRRVRRRGWALAGVILMTAGLAVAVPLGWGKARGVDPYPYQPLWALRWQLAGDAGREWQAWREIRRRQDAGMLSKSDRADVVGTLLRLQREPEVYWNHEWGSMIEAARRDGELDDGVWLGYLRGGLETVKIARVREIERGRLLRLGTDGAVRMGEAGWAARVEMSIEVVQGGQRVALPSGRSGIPAWTCVWDYRPSRSFSAARLPEALVDGAVEIEVSWKAYFVPQAGEPTPQIEPVEGRDRYRAVLRSADPATRPVLSEGETERWRTAAEFVVLSVGEGGAVEVVVIPRGTLTGDWGFASLVLEDGRVLPLGPMYYPSPGRSLGSEGFERVPEEIKPGMRVRLRFEPLPEDLLLPGELLPSVPTFELGPIEVIATPKP